MTVILSREITTKMFRIRDQKYVRTSTHVRNYNLLNKFRKLIVSLGILIFDIA